MGVGKKCFAASFILVHALDRTVAQSVKINRQQKHWNEADKSARFPGPRHICASQLIV
jgi:hypothetical protein